MTLHEAIAQLLGWSERDVTSFSLRSLREMVRGVPPSKLKDETLARIDAGERSGSVVYGGAR